MEAGGLPIHTKTASAQRLAPDRRFQLQRQSCEMTYCGFNCLAVGTMSLSREMSPPYHHGYVGLVRIRLHLQHTVVFFHRVNSRGIHASEVCSLQSDTVK